MAGLLGIRREDKNIWERRVPLSPEHLKRLKDEHDIHACLQPFPARAFSDDEYRQVGSRIDDDLSSCDVILAVKEIPPSLLLSDKIYLFFSHTIKGQPYNMPMLQQLIDSKSTLIDYECIADENGKRQVFFGRFAGLAGMLDALYALGQRYHTLGIKTPFLDLKPAYQYKDLADAKQHVDRVGSAIRRHGLSKAITPLTVGFAGYGHVSRGAQEIFNLLPHQTLAPDQLSRVNDDQKCFKVVFKEQDMVEPAEPDFKFQLRDYYVHPQKYRSIFERYLPHLSMLVNGIYWDSRYPRLVTKAALHRLLSAHPAPHLQVIADISCDINGSIECTEKVTEPDQPTFVYDPLHDSFVDGIAGNGVAVLAVDNLPAELPRDASFYFGEALWPLLPDVINTDWKVPFDTLDLPVSIKKAVIVYHGDLTPAFEYLNQYLSPPVSG